MAEVGNLNSKLSGYFIYFSYGIGVGSFLWNRIKPVAIIDDDYRFYQIKAEMFLIIFWEFFLTPMMKISKKASTL